MISTSRTLFALLVAFAVGGGLVACSNQPGGTSGGSQDPASTGITSTIKTDTQGLIVAKSPYDVVGTLNRVRDIAESKGWRIVSNMTFTPQEKANMELDDIRMVFLVNQDADAVLVHKAPTMAIELPRRILSWQDKSGGVYIAFHDEREMAARHGIKLPDPIVTLLADGMRDIVNEAMAYDEDTAKKATQAVTATALSAGAGAGAAAGTPEPPATP